MINRLNSIIIFQCNFFSGTFEYKITNTEMTEDGFLFINISSLFYFSSTKYRIERRIGRLLFELIYLCCFFTQRININLRISSFNFIVCLIFIQCAFFHVRYILWMFIHSPFSRSRWRRCIRSFVAITFIDGRSKKSLPGRIDPRIQN
jgi:hypothetical protein